MFTSSFNKVFRALMIVALLSLLVMTIEISCSAVSHIVNKSTNTSSKPMHRGIAHYQKYLVEIDDDDEGGDGESDGDIFNSTNSHFNDTIATLRYSSLQSCKRNIEVNFQYTFEYSKYVPSSAHVKDLGLFYSHLNKISKNKYPCSHNSNILKINMRSLKKTTLLDDSFQTMKYFKLMRNRNLVILGDSLASQFFQNIDAELTPFEDASRDIPSASDTNYNVVLNVSTNGLNSHQDAAIRCYNSYNTSIYFCRVNIPTFKASKFAEVDFCLKSAVQRAASGNHVLLIATGAWFKPSNQAFTDATASLMFRKLRIFRRQLQAMVRNDTLILWRLNSHMGDIDELASQGYSNYTHTAGRFWDVYNDTSASWPSKFNDRIRDIAREFNDLIIDHFVLSNKLLDFIRTGMKPTSYSSTPLRAVYNVNNYKSTPVKIHSDSLHYCPGGLFRLGHKLLLDTLEYHNNCYDSIRQI